jgi:hypothetical protein
MAVPISPSATLIPRPPELRYRLALALQEVDLLRRLIRVSECAARYSHSVPTPLTTHDREVPRAG